MSEPTPPATPPSLVSTAVQAIISLSLYGAIGTVVAGLVSLGTDGVKLTLIGTIAGFGAAVSLGQARDQARLSVLAIGAGLLVLLNALARAIDVTVPFTVYHPLSSVGAAVVCLGLIFALHQQKKPGEAREKSEADA